MASSAVVVVLFWQTVQTIVNIWAHSRTYAHGILVLPATIYMVWCWRDRLLKLHPVANSWGLVLLGVLVCGWFGGEITQSLIAQQAALIAMVPALVWAFLGTDVFRTLQFPLGFLVFALPAGASIEPWLQSVTARFIIIGLNLAGIPLSRDGYFITIPSGTWEVAPDCGGLRYLLPGLALAYVYTAVMHHTLKQRVTFLVVCAGGLIFANGVRAYGIILGDYLGVAEGTDHRFFSYAVYGVTVALLGWLGIGWSEGDDQSGIADVSGPDPGTRSEELHDRS